MMFVGRKKTLDLPRGVCHTFHIVSDTRSMSMSFSGLCLRGGAGEVRLVQGTQDTHNRKPYIATGEPT